jgi:hypothetical protein
MSRCTIVSVEATATPNQYDFVYAADAKKAVACVAKSHQAYIYNASGVRYEDALLGEYFLIHLSNKDGSSLAFDPVTSYEGQYARVLSRPLCRYHCGVTLHDMCSTCVYPQFFRGPLLQALPLSQPHPLLQACSTAPPPIAGMSHKVKNSEVYYDSQNLIKAHPQCCLCKKSAHHQRFVSCPCNQTWSRVGIKSSWSLCKLHG